MEEELLVLNMAVLLLMGGFCSIIFKRLKMPAVIGYLISGIIITALGLRSAEADNIVEFLSDIGLALMMFCIGMELNLNKLKKMGSFAILVVMIQVPIILIGGMVLGGLVLGLNSLQALIFGAIISGSSTAVVTIVLADQNSMSHSDVETLILVTVVEDVFQVLILSAITPLMQGSSMNVNDLVWMIVMIIIFMVSAIVIGIALFPKFLDWLHKKMPAEILVIIALGICFGLSYLAIRIGMSMAIGAFLAGVIVSQSVAKTAVEENVTPMKDVFMMMFFISIGMEITVNGLTSNIGMIIIIYLIYFALKSSSVIIAYFIGNKSMTLAYNSSIALVAMGEFAFIISKQALDGGLVSNDFYTSVIGAALLSMIVLPVINKQNDKVINFFAVKSPKIIQETYHKLDVKRGRFYDHLSMISKNAQASLKSNLASVYINILIVIVIQVLFAVCSPAIVNFIDSETTALVDRYIAAIAVMLLNFLCLVPSLYFIIRYLKNVFRVMLDAERRAATRDNKTTHKPTSGFMKNFIKWNSWVMILVLDFALLLVTPNSVDIWGHLLVLAAGVILIVFTMMYTYVRRS